MLSTCLLAATVAAAPAGPYLLPIDDGALRLRAGVSVGPNVVWQSGERFAVGAGPQVRLGIVLTEYWSVMAQAYASLGSWVARPEGRALSGVVGGDLLGELTVAGRAQLAFGATVQTSGRTALPGGAFRFSYAFAGAPVEHGRRQGVSLALSLRLAYAGPIDPVVALGGLELGWEWF